MSDDKQTEQHFTLKNDQYRRVRGGTAKFFNILCAKCNAWVLLYQKDGSGKVLRIYLNRIFAPPALAQLQHQVTETKDMTNLVCNSCEAVLGSPMKYDDGRLAFFLRHGFVAKQKSDGTYSPRTEV